MENLMTDNIKGLIAAPFTPFNQAHKVDYDAIGNYAIFFKNSGLAGVFINGTTGEGLSLTTDERKKLAECWLEYADDDFKLIVHVGSTSIEEAGILASHASQIGAWGVGMQGPCFFKPSTVEDLVDFCSQVASKAGLLPFYYYHMPAMTGVNFKMADFLRSADGKIKNLAGIKFTHEDLMDFQLCKVLFDGKYDMLFGRDEMLLCGLALGARGAVGSTYNYLPDLYLEMISLYDKGEIVIARGLQEKSMMIIDHIVHCGNPITCGKYLMNLHGIDLGGCRLPLSPPPKQDLQKLKEIISNIVN
jgi:N-acetylneuraminate lyase